MLSDTRIQAYYAYIVRYWTDKYNSATTNIEQDFSDYALTELDRLQGHEDNEVNRGLFTSENNAQADFIDVSNKNKAGLSTQEDVDAALAIFRSAKLDRQAVLPNTEILIANLTKDATDFLVRTRKQLEKRQDDNSEQAVIVAQRVVSSVEDFGEKLRLWVTTQNAKEQNDKFSGVPTSSPEDIYAVMGYFKDGNYGKEINRVSPEGFVYGATTFIQRLEHLYWWNGGEWLKVSDTIDQAASVQLLPEGPQEPDTVFRVINSVNSDGSYNWRHFFWDAEIEAWSEIQWFWVVENGKKYLPLTGRTKGEGHPVIEPDVMVMWDGEDWRRLRISSLLDDIGVINTIEIYGDTLESLTPDVELVYMSPIELSLRPIDSDFEYTTVNGMTIDSSKRVSVYSFSPVLDWWDETESFSTSLLQHSTALVSEEYYVYLGNKNDCFNLSTYDFRGRLFCSKTIPLNSRLGKFGTDAYNAILVGRCQTAVPTNVSDRVEFLSELDVSLISKAADLKETFREFSDFDLVYIDENTIQLKRTDGTAGQIFIGGRLYFLGESISLDITDTRINIDGNGLISFDTSTISQNTFYYVYIAPDSDIYNNNAINPDTNMPWHLEDEGAGDGVAGPYYANIDLRLKMFLSTKGPEEGRLSETWRGFWCRHIGQVETDGVKKFRYSASLSSIRQMVLNPTFFDGLAEIMLEPKTTEEFRVIKAAGSSGICMVGGRGVQTYITSSTSPMVHIVRYNDKVWTYTGSETTPLVWNGTYLYQYTTSFAYLYLTNDNPVWNSLFTTQGRERNSGTGCLFLATNPPTDAYLSSSFPGSNARWICTVGMDSSGRFSGSYIAENLKQPQGNSAVPTGTILDFAGPTCPNGFLVCNGSWYYPAQYPNLWAAIGGYWGWDGSRFAVPNLNYRATIGTGLWGLGSLVGKHTLDINDIPAHDHNHTHWHNHGGNTGEKAIYEPSFLNGAALINGSLYANRSSVSHTHTISSDATPNSPASVGGSRAYGNMQPSAVVLKIIRY